jgi:hypothetical protein
MRGIPGRFAAGVCLVCLAGVRAQNLLPNSSFEEGATAPAAWRLADGAGQWTEPGHDGRRAVTVRGTGEDQSSWRTEDVRLAPGRLFRLQFQGRRQPGASGGTATSGTGRVNRDFPLDDAWRPCRFVFAAPLDVGSDLVRVGQWHVKGEMSFDEVELVPVLESHTPLPGGASLGEAESIRGGVYRFAPDFNWLGANYHRPLATNRAGFNSNRWLFSPGAEVVYRHGLAGITQTKGRVRAHVNYHAGGTLWIEACRPGQAWQTVAEFDGQRPGAFTDLPATLFPAAEVLIRLRQAGEGGGFQVDSYEYEAALAGAVPEAEGETRFLEVLEHDPGLEVAWRSFGPQDRRGLWRFELGVTNAASGTLSARAHLVTLPRSAPGGRTQTLRLAERAGTTLVLSGTVEGPGEHLLRAMIRDQRGRALFSAQTTVRLGLLDDRGFGYALAGKKGLDLWWCESGWKVGRDRAPPRKSVTTKAGPVTVSAARGEYEAVQVVLRPAADCTLISAQAGRLRDTNRQAGPISVRLDEVAYVQVTRPTDASCAKGSYPDPLPPLRTPLALRAGQNQPLWLTVHVSPEARAGEYHGKLHLRTTAGNLVAPLTVRVYDFTLPKETHLKSALGLGAGAISRYHGLQKAQDRQTVFENYLRNFAEHRISPYAFYDYAPIKLEFVEQDGQKRARVDFSAFDKAAGKWLDQHRFNTFQLPLEGMGGGTFQSRYLGQLAGYKEGSPEHARLFQDYLGQIEKHLRERGWLEHAFTYWFDEPDPKDYEFVVEGMKRLKAAAPGIKRLLTEQPEPALMGHVEIWCGLTPEWTVEKVRARRDAGEQVWWYICTGPKAPYLTEFIDHPGNELRLWPWQSWQYGVTGILVWSTIYWTSPLVFPEPGQQDPWTDPMSYVSGYGLPVGHVGFWGNGDGRFLYPPRRPPGASNSPNLEDPINSIRWENLRDGMEDYEYLWLLAKAVERLEKAQPTSPLLAPARDLLKVPPAISTDLTHFNVDPRPLLQHRERIARMLEQLIHTR